MTKHKACPFCSSTEDDDGYVFASVEVTEYGGCVNAHIACVVCGARGPFCDENDDGFDGSTVDEAIKMAWRKWDDR